MKLLKDFIANQLTINNYSPAMKAVFSLIIDDNMNRIAIRECLDKYGLTTKTLKPEAFIVIFRYANECLNDDILNDEEMRTIGLLKIFFNIEEGDFIKYGEERSVKHILTRQLQKMYADNVIDIDEAIQKTKLQELFGLSYDEFSEYVNIIAREALGRGANLLNLDTVM